MVRIRAELGGECWVADPVWAVSPTAARRATLAILALRGADAGPERPAPAASHWVEVQPRAYGGRQAGIDRNLKFDSAIPREMQAQIRLEW